MDIILYSTIPLFFVSFFALGFLTFSNFSPSPTRALMTRLLRLESGRTICIKISQYTFQIMWCV